MPSTNLRTSGKLYRVACPACGDCSSFNCISKAEDACLKKMKFIPVVCRDCGFIHICIDDKGNLARRLTQEQVGILKKSKWAEAIEKVHDEVVVNMYG